MEPSQMNTVTDSSLSHGLMMLKMLFRYLISTSFTGTQEYPQVHDEDGRGRGWVLTKEKTSGLVINLEYLIPQHDSPWSFTIESQIQSVQAWVPHLHIGILVHLWRHWSYFSESQNVSRTSAPHRLQAQLTSSLWQRSTTIACIMLCYRPNTPPFLPLCSECSDFMLEIKTFQNVSLCLDLYW